MTRLYLPHARHVGSELTLDGDRSHYLCRVLRCRAGDTVECFDGRGRTFAAVVRDANPKRCTLTLTQAAVAGAAPVAAIHLVQAILKSDLEWVVQKCTELGATDFWLVATARSESQAARTSRLERVAHSACEQSGRVWVPRFHPVPTFTEFLAQAPRALRLIAVPGAPALETSDTPEDCCILIGPEGGWTAQEISTATGHGFRAIGLGDLTLRATTAGIAALAALRQSWGWKPLGL